MTNHVFRGECEERKFLTLLLGMKKEQNLLRGAELITRGITAMECRQERLVLDPSFLAWEFIAELMLGNIKEFIFANIA